MKYLNHFELNDLLFIMDRGFFSQTNVLEMHQGRQPIKFIQPLPFNLNKTKALLRANQRKLADPIHAFKYKQEIINYVADTVKFDQHLFDAHLYYSEKTHVHLKHKLMQQILEIENKCQQHKFEKLKDYLDFKKNNIPKKYQDYMKLNKASMKIEKNTRKIKQRFATMGSFILATNQKKLSQEKVLTYYRNKDSIEKIFDIVKNEMDGNRLRAHGKYVTDGRFFIKFIALIIYMEIVKRMRDKKLFDRYTVKELFAELRKLKINELSNKNTFLSEVTKKQRAIFKAFDCHIEDFHSY